MLSKINTEDVLAWDTDKLWNTTNTLRNDPANEIEEEEYEKIRDGYKFKYHVGYIINGHYKELPKKRAVIIDGFGPISYKEFEEEKERRDSAMRRIIIENLESGEDNEPRVNDD